MKNFNWKVRFSKDNMLFVLRFVGALAIPVLAYLGLELKDLTSWEMLGEVLINFISNPYLLILTFANAVNMTIDPTTKGIKDSEIVLNKDSVK